jgi:hypothetical protein
MGATGDEISAALHKILGGLALFCILNDCREIFSLHAIRSITVAHMEVPCCSGVRYVIDRAMEISGKKIPVTDTTITIQCGVE